MDGERAEGLTQGPTAAPAHASSPRGALECLNQQLLMRSTRGFFVTMACLVREAQSGELCYASGGHLPMLRRRGATPDVEILCGDEGLPLGIEKDSMPANRKIPLAPGDTLLLVTDGVVEALGLDRGVFKMQKRAEIFRQQGSSASQLVEEVFEAIGLISPTSPEDDLAVLAFTWTPQRTGVRK